VQHSPVQALGFLHHGTAGNTSSARPAQSQHVGRSERQRSGHRSRIRSRRVSALRLSTSTALRPCVRARLPCTSQEGASRNHARPHGTKARNKSKEAPNTCTLQPHVSHHGHPLTFPFTGHPHSQVCTVLPAGPSRPVQPAQGRCRPFTARLPFSTRRTWPACQPDGAAARRLGFSLPPPPSPFSCAFALLPTTTTDISSSAPSSALTGTRPTQHLDTTTGPPRPLPHPSLADPHHHD
jgi:hypothetical protein